MPGNGRITEHFEQKDPSGKLPKMRNFLWTQGNFTGNRQKQSLEYFGHLPAEKTLDFLTLELA